MFDRVAQSRQRSALLTIVIFSTSALLAASGRAADPGSLDEAIAEVQQRHRQGDSRKEISQWLSEVLDRRITNVNYGGADTFTRLTSAQRDFWEKFKNANLTHEQVARQAWEHGVGKCGEHGRMAYYILRYSGVAADDTLRVLNTENGSTHCTVVWGEPNIDAADPDTWGADTAAVDGWLGESLNRDQAWDHGWVFDQGRRKVTDITDQIEAEPRMVPDVIGLHPEDAQAKLQRWGFVNIKIHQGIDRGNHSERGKVYAQTPKPDAFQSVHQPVSVTYVPDQTDGFDSNDAVDFSPFLGDSPVAPSTQSVPPASPADGTSVDPHGSDAEDTDDGWSLVRPFGDVMLMPGVEAIPTAEQPRGQQSRKLRQHDSIKTRSGTAALEHETVGQVRIERNTDLQVRSIDSSGGPNLHLGLNEGQVQAELHRGKTALQFDVSTPNARVRVVGTEFSVLHEEDKQLTTVRVHRGEVEVVPTNKKLPPFRLRAGEQETIPRDIPTGLYLEAGTAKVRRGDLKSIPVYLRYRGPKTSPPQLASLNFELDYQGHVATATPHPRRDTKSPSKETAAPPDLVRGNLLSGSVLIAGNQQTSGQVLAGIAGKSGVKPGIGKRGETVTELYFKAVGQPGDFTRLTLKVTMASDEQGHEIPVETVDGWIEIVDAGPSIGPCDSGTKPEVKALDAYRALLMSVSRLSEDRWLDVDHNGSVTSRDAAIILEMAGQDSGELQGAADCSGQWVGPSTTRKPTPSSQLAPVRKTATRPPPTQPPVTRPPPTSGHPDNPLYAGPFRPTHNPVPQQPRQPTEPERVTPLDAYRALLMSVNRIPVSQRYDRNRDGQVTSLDSVQILRDSSPFPGALSDLRIGTTGGGRGYGSPTFCRATGLVASSTTDK